ncbi:MAG: glutamate racemase [Clostridiales bacterium]|jgi:glutamate racemase|nr:glutamate racemase [Clostridiales bacterium]
MDKRPIGVFDSGLGGLTVVKELMKELPAEDIVYFGDTARIPYGTRSREIVIKYSSQSVRFLLSKNVKLAVIACNTASASSFEYLKNTFDLPLVGVIQPGAQAAAEATRNGKVGVIGTSGTIRSRAYPNAIKAVNPDISVYDQPCTLFVPIVEEGWSNTEIARLTAERYLKGLKQHEIDTLVLGCTHYPLLENTISHVMGPDVRLINPAVNTALKVKEILENSGRLNQEKKQGKIEFYVSDFGQGFQTIGGRFLGTEIHAECIDIEQY